MFLGRSKFQRRSLRHAVLMFVLSGILVWRITFLWLHTSLSVPVISEGTYRVHRAHKDLTVELVSSENELFHVRMIGIQSIPQPPWKELAFGCLLECLQNEVVEVRLDRRRIEGRVQLAHLYVNDCLLSEFLLAEGLVNSATRGFGSGVMVRHLRKTEIQAKLGGCGIWKNTSKKLDLDKLRKKKG